MGRITFFTILTLLAIGCAPHQKTVQVDPAFQGEYQSFLKDSAEVGVPQAPDDLIIQFGEPTIWGCANPPNGLVEGCCHTGKGETPTIVIRQTDWDKLDAADLKSGTTAGTSKMVLVYHELGHCVLGRGHDDEMHSNNPTYGGAPDFPASVMESHFSGYIPDLFNQYRKEYVMELFGKGPGPEPFGS